MKRSQCCTEFWTPMKVSDRKLGQGLPRGCVSRGVYAVFKTYED